MHPESSTQTELPVSRYLREKREAIDSFLAFARGETLPKWPLEIFLEVSNVCDLKCAMCPTFSALNPERGERLQEDERGFLQFETVGRSLDEVLKHALNVHCFGFGEPTIHPRFEQFIAEISKFEVLIDFFTNGMHMTSSLARFLVEHRVANVTFSFSGTTKEEYENVYLGANYEQVLNGIRALSTQKLLLGSAYPIIEINSLGFEHHVARLDTFVDLMADCGVNVIHLKELFPHRSISPLAGHASVLRPWAEGEILKRAHERAKVRGVLLSSVQYDAGVVLSDSARAERKTKVPSFAQALEPVVPITQFKELARKARVAKSGRSTESKEQALPKAGSGGTERLEYTRFESDEPFYCFEPFKTFYVRRNGTVKPCCFAGNDSALLGDVTLTPSDRIWHGTEYRKLQESILKQEYPMRSCAGCLKFKLGPRRHFMHAKFRQYGQWVKSFFAGELDPRLANSLVELGDNSEIVERYLTRHPELNAPRIGPPGLGDLRDEPSEYLALLEQMATPQGIEKNRALLSGHFDSAEHGRAVGWATAPSLVHVRPLIDIFVDGELAVVGRAELFRTDLLLAGFGDGRYGFDVRLPEHVRDGRPHLITAQVRGSAFALRAEPIEIVLETSA